MEVGFVGKSKQKTRQGATSSWSGGSLPLPHNAIAPSTAHSIGSPREALYFQLKEFEDFRCPRFNVLYVETPRPEFITRPIQAFNQVVAETKELLRPILRLGIPENSLRNKLPYAREDNAPLPNSLRPRVQKLLKSNIEYAEKREAQAEQWQYLARAHADAAAAHAEAGRPPPVPLDLLQLQHEQRAQEHHVHHIPKPRFYTHPLPDIFVPLLNLAAYAYLCGGLSFRE